VTVVIRRLRATGVRNLAGLDIELPSGLVVFEGPNGSGKTSILEAVYLLGVGRSFRVDRLSKVATYGSRELLVVGDLVDASGQESVMGVQWCAPNEFRARFNGEAVRTTSALARLLGVVAIVPDSSILLTGEPAVRRRFVDQGVFHVKPEFHRTLLSYRRHLLHRTAALGQGTRALEAFESQLALDGNAIHDARVAYLNDLNPVLQDICVRLQLEGPIDVVLRPGWTAKHTLKEALEANRIQDRERGFTRPGPHRADLAVRYGGQRVTDVLSRGELKLLAYALNLAKVRLSSRLGQHPLVLMDDLGAELDIRHQSLISKCIVDCNVQCLMTNIGPTPDSLALMAAQVFHVEHGRLTSTRAT
jgi:DNA replication and repair protein RecF